MGGTKNGLMGKIRDERRDCRTVAGAGDQCGNGNDCLGCIVFCNQMVVKNGIMEVYKKIEEKKAKHNLKEDKTVND